MPTAPTFQDSDPGVASVSPSTSPTVRVQPEASFETFGGGGEKVQNAVDRNIDTINSIVNQETGRANNLASIEMSRKFSELETGIQISAISKLQGQDAVHAPDVAKDLWTKGIADISKMATNPALMAFYKDREAQHWDSLNSSVQHHVATEQIKFTDEVSQSALESEQRAAALHYADKDRAITAIGNQADIIVKWASNHGININTPEGKQIIQEKTDEATSKTLVGMAQGMIVNNEFDLARSFIESNKDKIYPPSTRATLENQLKQGEIYVAVNKVNDFMDSHRLPDGMMDIKAGHDFAKSFSLDPQEQAQIEGHIRSLVMVDNSETAQRQLNAQKSFVEDAMKQQEAGVPYSQVLPLLDKYSYSEQSRQQMTDKLISIYANPQSKFNAWSENQPSTMQAAIADGENAIKAKYGNRTGNVQGVVQKLAPIALDELKTKWISATSPDQVRKITDDYLKTVVTTPGIIFGNFWPNKQDRVLNEADKDYGKSLMMSALRTEFGSDNVDKAIASLALDPDPKPVTILNIKAKLLDVRKNSVKPK